MPCMVGIFLCEKLEGEKIHRGSSEDSEEKEGRVTWKMRGGGRAGRWGERKASRQLPDAWCMSRGARTAVSRGMKASAAGWISASGWQRQMAAEGDRSLRTSRRASINPERLDRRRSVAFCPSAHTQITKNLARTQQTSGVHSSATMQILPLCHVTAFFSKQTEWSDGSIQWDAVLTRRFSFSLWSVGSRFIFLIPYFIGVSSRKSYLGKIPCSGAFWSSDRQPTSSWKLH